MSCSYFFKHTKFEINNNSSNLSARPTCTLAAGTDSDTARPGTSDNSTDDDTAVATLTVVHSFAAAGQVTLACDSGRAAAQDMLISQVKITAIRVGSLTNTAF